jgi:hydroxybutyrate-dimer hydrolase
MLRTTPLWSDHLCGLSFFRHRRRRQAGGLPVRRCWRIFGTFSGIPPNSSIGIINNDDPVSGAILNSISVSPSTGVPDFNLDAAICQRNLFTGTDAPAQRVQSGINEVKRAANLHGKPAIIVHGRADTLFPVAFTSRPYFGANKIVEGAASKLSYIEVTDAQHFDAFIGGDAAIDGYDSRVIPLNKYFIESMNMMYAHLKSGAALPGSQVVRTVPRGGTPGAPRSRRPTSRRSSRYRLQPMRHVCRQHDHSRLNSRPIRAVGQASKGRAVGVK